MSVNVTVLKVFYRLQMHTAAHTRLMKYCGEILPFIQYADEYDLLISSALSSSVRHCVGALVININY